MSTFVNDDNGNSPVNNISIMLGSNSGSGFQQKVDFNPSNFPSSYFASDLSNINFQDGAGNLLYSWQETHAPTTSSTDVIYWVKLPNSTINTIYLVLVSTTSSSYSTNHTGVEPNYNSTYAQYDNGTNVFSNYWNFSGTSLPTGWAEVDNNSGGTYSVNNGLILEIPSGTSSTNYVVVYYDTNTFTLSSLGVVLDIYAYIASGAEGYASMGIPYIPTVQYQGNIASLGYNSTSGNFENSTFNGNFSAEVDMPISFNSNYNVWTWYSNNAGIVLLYNYGSETINNIQYNSVTNHIGYYESGLITPAFGTVIKSYWCRIRNFPPNGQMPSTIVGTFIGSQNYKILKGKGPKKFIDKYNSSLLWQSVGILSYSASAGISTVSSQLANELVNASITINTYPLLVNSTSVSGSVGINVLSHVSSATNYVNASANITTSPSFTTSSNALGSVVINSRPVLVNTTSTSGSISINAVGLVRSATNYISGSAGIGMSPSLINNTGVNGSVNINATNTPTGSSLVNGTITVQVVESQVYISGIGAFAVWYRIYI
jgi:hypothetical protein